MIAASAARSLLAFVVALAGFTGAAGAASKVVINPDNVIEINGERTLLIGFIMPPPPDGKTPGGRNAIEELSAAGATFLRTGIFGQDSQWDEEAFEKETRWQDAAARHGMHCLVGLRIAGSVSDEQPQNEAALRRVIATFRDHPGMGAYYGIDEPQWNKHPVEPMERAYDIIRELDPAHPVWICQAPRGTVEQMREYDDCGNATGGDIYPISFPPGIHVPPTAADVPEMLRGNSDISLAGDFTRMMMQVADGKKPVWMCLQIAWSGVHKPGKTLRFPTFPEQRFMTYQTLINGARGVIYFGGQIAHTLSPADRKLGWNWTHWDRVLRPVIEEIGKHSPLYPALLAPESKLPIKVQGSGIEYAVREAGNDVFILACRRDHETSQITFSGLPDGLTKGEVMFESPRAVQATDGVFTDWFAPFQVHVYRFSR